jgi:hypothetical protein
MVFVAVLLAFGKDPSENTPPEGREFHGIGQDFKIEEGWPLR